MIGTKMQTILNILAKEQAKEVPDPPEWVIEAGEEATWAWAESLWWRYDAAAAQGRYYREFLVTQAKNIYWMDSPPNVSAQEGVL